MSLPTDSGSTTADQRLPLVTRSSQSTTVTLYDTDSNSTFSDRLCTLAGSGPSSGDFQISFIGVCTRPYLLPDCFFIADVSGVTSFQATCVLLQGNQTFPDPMLRLANSLPGISAAGTATLVYLTQCTLLASSGSLAPINWTALFNLWPLLRVLYMLECSMAPTSLPTYLPAALYSFNILNCGLVGSIPATMYANFSTFTATSLSLVVPNNALTGSIPPALFSNVNMTNIATLSINLNNNKMYGPIAPTLLAHSFQMLTALSLDLANNAFTGPFSNLLDATSLPGARIGTVFVSVNNNSFTGDFPATWFSYIKAGFSLSSLSVSAANNRLSGTLPSTTWLPHITSSAPSVTINLANNSLHGDIPDAFLNFSVSPSQWAVDLSNNAFNGTIGSNIFQTLLMNNTYTASFDFSQNQLTGGLPSSLVGNTTAAFTGSLTLNVAQNPKMTGSVPSSLFSSLLALPSGSQVSPFLLAVIADNTPLTGTLNIPAGLASLKPPFRIAFSAVNANLDAVAFQDALSLLRLDLTNNARLTGTLPAFLFGNTSLLTSLSANGTALSGVMPDMGANSASILTVLQLANTGIDFCSGSRSNWTSSTLETCQLAETSASNCAYAYPSLCKVSATTCLDATRPSSEWVCVGGTWTLIGSVTAPVLVIPSGSTETVVIGNVTSGSVVITGLGSTLIIQQGCASNLSTVTLEVTHEELEKLGKTTQQTLISLDPDASCSGLDNVQVILHLNGKSCKKASLKTSTSSDGNVLSAILSINDSGCRTWWIILVSVICGVIVLAAIIFALLVLLVRPVREFVRPYSKPRKPSDKGEL